MADVLDALGDPVPTFRWSFSQWETYHQCPAKWKFRYRMRLPGLPSGPAAARGTECHKRVDNYIMGVDTDINRLLIGDKNKTDGYFPADIDRKYLPVIQTFREHENGDVGAEKKLGLDVDWSPHPPTSPMASAIGVLDAYRFTNAGELYIGEWKTGQPKDTHPDQRSLYALFGLKHWNPKVVYVTTYYLENTAEPTRLKATPEAEGRLIDKWSARIDQMRGDSMGSPRPGFYCRWCDYSKVKGGPCEFGR
jgi:hypothetical protein